MLIISGVAISYMNFCQVGGLAIILTISNTIFLNLAITYVAKALPNSTLPEVKNAVSGVSSDFIGSLSQHQQAEVLHALVQAISKTYILIIACGCLQLVLAFGLKWEKAFMPR
jgi:hypothetical protein